MLYTRCRKLSERLEEYSARDCGWSQFAAGTGADRKAQDASHGITPEQPRGTRGFRSNVRNRHQASDQRVAVGYYRSTLKEVRNTPIGRICTAFWDGHEFLDLGFEGKRTMLIAVFLALLMQALAADDPSSKEQPAIALTASSSKVLPMPSFQADAGPRCDSSGNLYFHTGVNGRESVILKLAASDGSPTVYRPIDETIEGTYFAQFYVTGDRKIGILVGGKKHEPYVYEFNADDPVNATHTRLDAPEEIQALSVRGFVLLPNDRVLLQGYLGDRVAKDKRGHGYLAEFGPSGKLIRMSVAKTSDDVSRSLAQSGASSAAAQGEDGMIYLLEGDRVAVLTPAGTLQREIKLTAPRPGFTPAQLYLHGRQLVVGFAHADGPGKVVTMLFALLDPSTGEVIRLYEPSTELGSGLVCFSDEGLVFMKFENRHVKLITAPIR